VNERYFYTKHYPHRWTSGPDIYHSNGDWKPIVSLDEARELALKHRHLSYHENRCTTTYGVEYLLDEDQP
jgi:hypothetical protein